MSVLHAVAVALAILFLTLTAIFAVIRIVRGPTILDRMVASDVLLSTLILTAGADMVLRGHTDNILLMVATAATAVLATIVVARFVKRRAAAGEKAESSGDAGHV